MYDSTDLLWGTLHVDNSIIAGQLKLGFRAQGYLKGDKFIPSKLSLYGTVNGDIHILVRLYIYTSAVEHNVGAWMY